MSRYVIILFLFGFFTAGRGLAQTPDFVYSPSIRTPQLYMAGNQLGYPILRLGTSDQLELHFDDLDNTVKNYYYSVVLCNEDWTPAEVTEFDYIKGFNQIRIENYQLSSISQTRYTHYQAVFPDPNCQVIHSGNYMLKVFLDGDTSKLAFTKRFLVSNSKISIESQFLQPLNFDLSATHQRIQLRLNVASVNPTNALDQIKVVILQNYRWDNALHGIKPNLYFNNDLQYNTDDAILFEGGMEYRWLDLQSFRYLSDRVQSATDNNNVYDVIAKPDGDRSKMDYYYYKDYNGKFYIQTTESINAQYQTDYANVHFSFVPKDIEAFADKDVYVLGNFTGGGLNDSSRMTFNADKGRFERTFQLKNGYYSYEYVTVDKNDPTMKPSFAFTEGNHIATQNEYIILVYYRPPAGRADELIGLSKFNSVKQ